MTDQIPTDVTDNDRRIARDWAEHIIRTPFTSLPMEAAVARVILHAVPAPPPKRPTLADMTEAERAACQWMQADVYDTKGGGEWVIRESHINAVQLVNRSGKLLTAAAKYVTPRPDLPRLEWPGDTPAPAPIDQEDYPPRDQLTQGAKWHDIAKLEEALRQKGEAADQAIVIDDEGDAHVWEIIGGGGWMARVPVQQCGPFRLILNDQEADQ